MVADNLAQILWEQKTLLDELEFRLEALELVARAGRHNRIAKACQEVAVIRAQMDTVDDRRRKESAAYAASLGIDPNSPLTEIAKKAPAEWALTFTTTRVEMNEQLRRIEALVGVLRGLLTQRLDLIDELLGGVLGVPNTYQANGTVDSKNFSLVSQIA
ncbi:MAG: hypothetical protein HKL82_05090 [Acidimicrobiaceae bacterium]|nr:hypothetical protein [Acidimicrobiaceae bacterium]